MKTIIGCLSLLLATGAASADGMSEADVQAIICAGKEMEVVIPSGARADCVDDTYAIEVDWTEKWAEAIGQSLHYAESLDKKPAIYLVCHDTPANCLRDRLRLEETISAWNLPIQVFTFDVGDLTDDTK